MSIFKWWLKVKEKILPARRLDIFDSDELPARLPHRDLVLARQDGESWSVGMLCPCGCRQRIELPLLKEIQPRWDVKVETSGKPTLNPSIWLREGCRSHFFIRNGRVIWL